MTKLNGFSSYNAFLVDLYINNCFALYSYTKANLQSTNNNASKAATKFIMANGTKYHNAKFTLHAVKEALEGIADA